MKRAAVTSAGVAIASVTETAFFSAAARADIGGEVGATFGASVQPLGKQSTQDALLELEQIAQRKFTTVLNRMPWQTSLVNRYSEFIAARGQIPMLSWFTRGRGGDVKWSAIANGAQDNRIRSEAQSLKAAGWPAYFCFHKEPENEPWLGNANEWKGAHERIWQIFQEVGVTNVSFIPVMMAPTYKGSFGGINAWLPDHYDVLGVDGYNRNLRGKWRPLELIMTPAHEVATALGRPLFIVEHGCVEGAPDQKRQWFQDAQAIVKSWPEVIGVSYNNETGRSGLDARMNYRIDTSETSKTGFRAMGASPHFNPTQTFFSSHGQGGPPGGGDPPNPPPHDKPSAAERRRLRRHRQRLRARRRRHQRHRRHPVNRSGAPSSS